MLVLLFTLLSTRPGQVIQTLITAFTNKLLARPSPSPAFSPATLPPLVPGTAASLLSATAVLSEASLQSEWVMTELRKARQAERQCGQRKLFPVRLVDMETLRDWECFDADSPCTICSSRKPSMSVFICSQMGRWSLSWQVNFSRVWFLPGKSSSMWASPRKKSNEPRRGGQLQPFNARAQSLTLCARER